MSELPRLKQVWAYGVTTVRSRRADLLPRTLQSLKQAGFHSPQLFVDNDSEIDSYRREFNIEIVTCHYPIIRTYGNWFLGIYELYIRNPSATRYAMFQDDLITYINLIYYLDQCNYPDKGYWNLYTFPSNQTLAPRTTRGGTKEGWYISNQLGRGAVGLVFSRQALLTLFGQPHMIERPMDAHRGHRAIDGGIVTAMTKAGYQEWVHSPSLIQHTGSKSSMGNKPHPLSNSFIGESFNALDLVGLVEKAKSL